MRRLVSARIARTSAHGARWRSVVGAASVLACLLTIGGCTAFETPLSNDDILKELSTQYAASARPFRREQPDPRGIAIAPIRLKLTTGAGEEGEAGEEGAAPTEGAPATAPAAAPADSTGASTAMRPLTNAVALRPHAELRYRRAASRQLLFAPVDPVLAEQAKKVTRRPRPAQADGNALYICPRCQNDVTAADEKCPTCGLALAPAADGPQAPGPRKPGGTIVVNPKPAPYTEPAPLPDAQGGERHICYLCGFDLPSPNAASCPNCHVSFPVVEGGEQETQNLVVDIDRGQPYFSSDGRRATFPPDADELQEELTTLVKDYGIFNEVVALTDKDMDDESVVAYAATQNLTYVLIPTLRRYEVSYEGANGWWVPSFALWLGAWVPSFWVPSDDFTFNMELELKLVHARSGNELKGWTRRYPTQVRASVDQFDRGWYPWGLILVPAASLIRESGFLNLHNGLEPKAREQIKRQVLEQFYLSFVSKPVPDYPARSKRYLGGIVGVDRLEEMPSGAQPLAYVGNDLDAMERALEDVTGWVKPKAGQSTLSSGEVMRFDGAAALEHKPTLANLRRFLSVDLQVLQKEDTFLFYFSGYGVSIPSADDPWGDGYERYLCLADTKADDIPNTGLALSEVKKYLDQAVCRDALVILDTSFGMPQREVVSGQAKTLPLEGLEPDVEAMSDAFLEALSRRGSARKCAVLAAAGRASFAVESELLGMSLLTDTFVKAIRGVADLDGDRQVLVDEAYTHTVDYATMWGFGNLGVGLEPLSLGQLNLPVVLKPKVQVDEPAAPGAAAPTGDGAAAPTDGTPTGGASTDGASTDGASTEGAPSDGAAPPAGEGQ